MTEIFFDQISKEAGQVISRRSALRLMTGFFVYSLFGTRFSKAKIQESPSNNLSKCVPVIDIVGCVDGYNRTPKPDVPIEVNGCGSGDADVPDSYFGVVHFTEDCNNHDRCYSNCEGRKPDCDLQLGKDMATRCNSSLASIDLLNRGLCYAMSATYTIGLQAAPPANEAYFAAQKKHCQCCLVGEQCPEGKECCGDIEGEFCNGECYDPATQQCCRTQNNGNFACQQSGETCCGDGTCCKTANGSCCTLPTGTSQCVTWGENFCPCSPCPTGNICCHVSGGGIIGCCDPDDEFFPCPDTCE